MSVERVRDETQRVVDELVASGRETGLQVAVVKDGRLVADIVGGVADPRTGAAVSARSLFWAGSTAKGVASSVAHVLVERGELDYEMRAADVWPEFGSHGKDGVTLRHVLLHTAGVPGLPPDTAVEDLLEWDRICAVIADQEPWWEPGTRFGYHATTFGFVLGEIVRRATGKTLSAHLREAISRPLGVEDEIHFGVPSHLLQRVARLVPPDDPDAPDDPDDPASLPEPGSPLDRAMPRGVVPDADYANRPDVLTADIPSQGTMSARGVARMYAALLGHVEGVPLVSPRRLAAMAAVACTGMDEVMGFPSSSAFGYGPARPGGVPARPGSAFGMVGMNGTAAYADIDSGVAVAVMRNRFNGDLTAVGRIDRLVAELLS
jgi:CubicO group peptidase (beta-lactamase class C family)